MLIRVARMRGYLERILPPKGYLGQKSLGTTASKHALTLIQRQGTKSIDQDKVADATMKCGTN